MTTRLKRIILSVNGDDDQKTIREFVDNYLLAKESRELREHILATQPDVDLTIVTSGGKEVAIPIGLRFFWPDFQ